MATTHPTSDPRPATDTGNDDASGEPVGNREPGDASSPAGLEVPGGNRGGAAGRNLEQLEQAREGPPGATRPAAG